MATIANLVWDTGGTGYWNVTTDSTTIDATTIDATTVGTASNVLTIAGSGTTDLTVGDALVYNWAPDGPADLGKDRQFRLPDGTLIDVDKDGNYSIHDKDAKVIYEASRMRAFNPYVNAGDLLARFIDFLRTEVPSIKRTDIKDLPLQLFVNWLVLEAAQQDGDPVPGNVVPVPKDRRLIAMKHPHCALPVCRRFIPRASAVAGFNYCNVQHAERHVKLLAA